MGSDLIVLTPEVFDQDLRIDPVLNHCMFRHSSPNLPLCDDFRP